MANKDYYSILGVSKNASKDDIKKAYRNLAHKHHPDKGGDAQKFKELNEAYQILGDENKKAQYDRFGTSFNDNSSGYSQGGGPFGFDFSQGFSESYDSDNYGFDGFEDIFESFFGGQRGAGSESHKKKGSDIILQADISFEEAALGVKKEFSVFLFDRCVKCSGTGAEEKSKMVKCKNCGGRGKTEKTHRIFPFGTIQRTSRCDACSGKGEIPEKVCPDCHGEGRKKEKRTMPIDIPAGIDNGQTIKIDGKGEAGLKNSPSGDLYLKIKVLPHKFFERKGFDVYLSQEVSFTQAVFGDKIEIPTLYGNLSLTVPSGIESGKMMKIAGKGTGKINSSGRGDMFVRIKIVTPKNVSKKAKKLLEELKEEGI